VSDAGTGGRRRRAVARVVRRGGGRGGDGRPPVALIDLERAEAEARVADELFRTAFEDAPIGMALWDLDRARDFRPTEVNRAMCRIVGHSAEELVKIAPRDLVHPDDFDAGRDDVLALLRGQTSSCSLEKRFIRGDGAVIWAHVRLSLARDAAGTPRWGICQFIDVTDRHGAHEALRASEQRLRKVVETAHEGIWLLDADDRTSFVNERGAEMLGYRVDEMLGRPVHDFLSEHGRALASARLAARREGVSDSHELRYIRKDGSEIWVIVSSSPLFEEHGCYSGSLDMLVDVTDRRRREGALRASEERYRNIIETTSEGVWMIDADHRTTYVNRRMAEMLGYRVEEMLGRPVADFAAPEGRTQIQNSLARRRAGVSDQRELPYLRKDGSEMWALLSGSPLSDGNGGYGGALAMISDITERKRAEQDLARLAAIVESSPDAIFSTALDGTITSWNRAAEELYGYSEAEAVGSSAWMLAPPDKIEESREVTERLLAGAATVAYRTTAVHRDGTVIDVEPSVSAIVASDGTTVGALAIIRAG
jgi:PAS domain S-box-containing protein